VIAIYVISVMLLTIVGYAFMIGWSRRVLERKGYESCDAEFYAMFWPFLPLGLFVMKAFRFGYEGSKDKAKDKIPEMRTVKKNRL